MSAARWTIATTDFEPNDAGEAMRLTAWAARSSTPWGAVARRDGDWLGAASAIAADVRRAGPFDRPEAIVCPVPGLIPDLRSLLPSDVAVVGTNTPDEQLTALIEEIGEWFLEAIATHYGPAVNELAVHEFHRHARRVFSRYAELTARSGSWSFRLCAEPGIERPCALILRDSGRALYIFDTADEAARADELALIGTTSQWRSRCTFMAWKAAVDLPRFFSNEIDDEGYAESGPGVWPMPFRTDGTGFVYPCGFDYEVLNAALAGIAEFGVGRGEDVRVKPVGRLTNVVLRNVCAR